MGSTFLEHFESFCADEPSAAARIGEILGRLEQEKTLATVATALSLEPEVALAALAVAALGNGRDDDGPPLVTARGGKRRLAAADALGEASLAGLYPGASRPATLAVAAGLLQMHDFWDASHEAAQQADDLGETSVSAYWHGIAHRREPDPGNASYWFRRVSGRHPVFARLAAAARPLLETHPELAARLVPREGTWDPFAFIEVCTRAPAAGAALARGLQRIEILLLLDASLPG